MVYASFLDHPEIKLDENQLKNIGILYWKLDADHKFERICQDRQYHNRDIITISHSTLGDLFEQKCQIFVQEHLHEDEECRFILEGSGFFDVRDQNDQWIRIHVEKHDFLIIPAGMYHRFTLDETKYIRAMRLFQEQPKWTPINRSSDTEQHPVRINYLKRVKT